MNSQHEQLKRRATWLSISARVFILIGVAAFFFAWPCAGILWGLAIWMDHDAKMILRI